MKPPINGGEPQEPVLQKLLLPGQPAILEEISSPKAASLSQLFKSRLPCRADIMSLGLKEG